VWRGVGGGLGAVGGIGAGCFHRFRGGFRGGGREIAATTGNLHL